MELPRIIEWTDMVDGDLAWDPGDGDLVRCYFVGSPGLVGHGRGVRCDGAPDGGFAPLLLRTGGRLVWLTVHGRNAGVADALISSAAAGPLASRGVLVATGVDASDPEAIARVVGILAENARALASAGGLKRVVAQEKDNE